MEFCSRLGLVILLLCSMTVISSFGVPPRYFHGRAQPSSLDSFFERALRLVGEVARIMNSSENDGEALEYCIARLESLLTNCVNLFHLLDDGLYNSLIDSIQHYLSLLRSAELHNVSPG